MGGSVQGSGLEARLEAGRSVRRLMIREYLKHWTSQGRTMERVELKRPRPSWPQS